MNELVANVTPLTSGLIWLKQGEIKTTDPLYGQIDYLLDGLLTSTLKKNDSFKSQVIIGENFKKPFYVMVIREAKESEIESFISLLKEELNNEKSLIVVDEAKVFNEIKSHFNKISKSLRFY